MVNYGNPGRRDGKHECLNLKLLFFYLLSFAEDGLCCCGFFSSCGEQGQLSSCDAGLRIVAAPLVAEQKLWVRASGAPRL